MFRPDRFIPGARAIGPLAIAVALAGALVAAPVAASGAGADPKSQRAPQGRGADDAENERVQPVSGPRRPGWVESLIGGLVPKPPGQRCRG